MTSSSTWRTDQLAYGGGKDSGIGREGSSYGIEEWVELKYWAIGGMGAERLVDPHLDVAALVAARESVAGELAEGDERLELTACPSVELAEGPIEGGFGGDRDDEDVRRDIPRLIGCDAKMHGSNASGKGAGEDR